MSSNADSLRLRLSARLIFILGLVLMLLGAAFLLGSLSVRSGLPVAASFLLIVIGVCCAVLAIKLHKRSLYLFFATFFILFGFFVFLQVMRIIPVSLVQSWPLLSVFAGLSLITAGWHHYHKARVHYIVCALVFIALGVFLSFFSFDILTFSFRQFMLNWWPFLMAAAGILLVILALSSGT